MSIVHSIVDKNGVLLHALLDSDTEDLGMFNAHMEAKNVRIIEGPSGGNAMLLGDETATVTIDLPFSPYLMPEGTIEFWAKLPHEDRPFSPGRGQPWFFGLERKGQTHNNHFVFGFNYNDGGRGGGLAGRIHAFASLATHRVGEVSSAAETGLLGDTPDGWHHYAVICKWDKVDFSEGQGNTLLFTIDGKVVAYSEQMRDNNFFDETRDTESKFHFVIHDSDSDCTFPVAMSDLKVWDYAKLPTVGK